MQEKGEILKNVTPLDLGDGIYAHFFKKVEYWKPDDILDFLKYGEEVMWIMQKKLTITHDEQVNEALHRIIGPQNISQFLESLVRPQVIETDLETAYRQMALDTSREEEALEWAEATCGDVQNETR